MALDVMASLDRKLGIGGPATLGPLPPQLAQKYERVKVVGKGSFGQAILIRRKSDDVQYIVKEVNMAQMTDRERRDAFNEITVLSKLNHPNIIKYSESCQHGHMLYIVMEYADGGDLWGYVQNKRNRGGLNEEEVLSYFIQISMALKHMHDKRMLHRDLKTGNVFLTNQQKVVKLGDFGISTALRNTVAFANTVCGTPNYFSPEMVQGKPYNNKSDIWALGCILYEMMAGAVAFQGNNMQEIYSRIVQCRLAPLPQHFSKELRALCGKLLSQAQAARPDINAVMRAYVVQSHIQKLQAKMQAQSVELSIPDRERERAEAEEQRKRQQQREEEEERRRKEEEKERERKAAASTKVPDYGNFTDPDALMADLEAVLAGSDLPPERFQAEAKRNAQSSYLPPQPDNAPMRDIRKQDLDAVLEQLGTLRDIEDILDDVTFGDSDTSGPSGATNLAVPAPMQYKYNNDARDDLSHLVDEELNNFDL